MKENTKIIIASISGVVALALIFTLYQSVVSIPRQQLNFDKQVRQDGIDYSNEQAEKLQWCLISAETDYWSWIELNMEEQEDGSFMGPQYNWDKAEASKKVDEDACYRLYTE